MAAPLALFTLLTLSPGAAPPSSPPWAIDFGLTGVQLKAVLASRAAAGYYPICVSGNNLAEDSRYAVVWRKGKGAPWRVDFGLTPAQLDRRGLAMKRDGYRPVSLSGFDLVGDQGFIDLWRKEGGPEWSVEYGKDAEGLTRLAAAMKAAGFRPLTVSTYVSGTFSRFATVWEKGGDANWVMKWGLSGSAFESMLTTQSNLGYRPVAISGLGVLTEVSYAAVWVKGKGPAWVARYDQDGNGLKTLAITMAEKGFRPVWLSGYNTLRGPRFATIWEKAER